MLVLSRKKCESIVINHDINIIVVEIRGDKVRLGVELHKDLFVHRREVHDALIRNEIQPFVPNKTVMLTPKAQQAFEKLAISGNSDTKNLEAILLKAAEMDQAADRQSNSE